jgi:2-succinyl-5-enolpyruvyl-6-hydroxy-3-cyclohexene-1-carboxylate synthase
MSGYDTTTSFARTFVDEIVRGGVTNAVVAPGSRNTPLSLALVRDGRVQVDVVLDERSAGFRALGLAVASGRPVVVGCTSGSAAVNLHPAVVEAFHARVPLLVCTADRPPELQGVGAPQTIDQTNLFGTAVRAFVDPGPPGDDASQWRPLARDAITAATGSPRGPVHVNLPFREPLLPTGEPLLEVPPLPHPAPLRSVSQVREAHLRDASGARGVLVAGWGSGVDHATVETFARRTGWPVLADAISNLRAGPHTITMYEALLRAGEWANAHRPDIVVRIGAPLTSKVANAWLDDAPRTVLIDGDGVWRDPSGVARERIHADPRSVLASLPAGSADPAWSDTWASAEQVARATFDASLDEHDAGEARIARDLAAAIPASGALVVASSMPVRALEWAMAPRADLSVFSNRGANGIDGFVSTALGIAAARPGAPTVALAGDLCFLHDTNGLLHAPASPPVTFVVVDNGGGCIFSYLPQHDLAEFEQLFLTPQSVDLGAVARAHGVAAVTVDAGDLPKLVADGSDRTRVLVVPVDGDAARVHHREAFAAVASRV